MHISQSLNVNALYDTPAGPAATAPQSKDAGSSKQTDTVQLSAAAKAHIAAAAGHDADGDNDGR